jgi:hypothetical protein
VRSNAPTKGDMGCVWPKGKQVANGDDKSNDRKNKKVFVQQIMNNWGGGNVQIQKRVPQCEMSAPGRAEIS